jgi:diaminobutyrate-2-oxoglutarate transaminase
VAVNLDIFNEMESEVRGYIRSFPVIFNKAIGSIMTDETGAEFIDFFSGAGTLNYGHNNPKFKQNILDYIQNDSIIHGLDMATTAKKHFLESFRSIILEPRGYNYKLQFTGPTGTNSVEAALKIARLVTGRVNVVAFTHAFHGVSAGSLATTANKKFRDAAGYALTNVTFVPYDGYVDQSMDTVAYLEKLLNDTSSGLDMPAAVIVETVQGEGGVNVARKQWLQALAQLCKDHKILLIADDIQIGCGRTGEFFSFEEAGIEPDIITLSKSLSGYGLPMSIVLMKPEYDIWKPGAHSGTFRGNNLAFVGAAAALEHYWKDDVFSKEIHRKQEIVQNHLQAIADAYPDAELTVRGRGLMQGLVSTKMFELAGHVSEESFKHGLIIETSGAKNEVLKILPALTIEDEVLIKGLDIIAKSYETILSA